MISCSRSSHLEDYFTWHIDPSVAQRMDLSKIVDSIFLVPLETNDSSLIKKIRSIEYVDGKYYINNDFSEIQIYDSLGHFLYSTRKCMGIGPNDYRTVLGFTRLPHDTLELIDAMAKKMRYYVHPEGLVKSSSLPSEVLPVTEYAWINGDTCVFVDGSTDNPVLKFYSKKRNAFFKKMEDRQKSVFVRTSNSLFRINDVLYYSPTYPSNELYVLGADLERKKVLQLDFGSYTFSMEDIPEDMDTKKSADYFSAHKEWVYPYTKYVLDSLYIAFFQFEERFCVACMNRNTGKNVVLKNEIRAKPQLMKPDYVCGDKLYYASEPGYLPYLVDKELMSPAEWAKMERVEETDNPVLIVYKMKTK